MSYKTIVVHVDNTPRLEERVRIAADLASSHQGHLVGAAMTGISRYFYESMASEIDASYLAAQLDLSNRQANQSLDRFDAEAAKVALGSLERRFVEDDPAGGLVAQANYCDLVIVGQTDPDYPSYGAIGDLPSYVMLNAVRPVLIVPRRGRFERIQERILVAWDASPSASRALAHALPLLKAATNTDLAVFNPRKQPGMHGEQPGADIALYLARHGIDVNVICRDTSEGTGNALLSLADELGSTSLVMGGYGHTRFRETILGGATRTILESMAVPVVMSHLSASSNTGTRMAWTSISDGAGRNDCAGSSESGPR